MRRLFARPPTPQSVLLADQPAVPVDHPLRPILDARYLDMRAAMASGDPDTVVALLTPDFFSEDLDGNRQTGRQMADAVARLQIDRSQRTVATILTGVALNADGDVADVEQRYQMTTTERSGNLPEKLLTKSRDRWELLDGVWFLASSTTLVLEVTKNQNHIHRARVDAGGAEIVIELRKRLPAGARAEQV